MRADIHGGPEHTLQSEAGYIDARPKSRQIDETLLRRTAGPYSRRVDRVADGLHHSRCPPDSGPAHLGIGIFSCGPKAASRAAKKGEGGWPLRLMDERPKQPRGQDVS
jgi:hypothetical protein